ncbi:MAG: thiopeptide-type bacteriocin biosynthesis protein, partial [Flavobacteriales bacterium]|nr:thiopeptide-type bacteriocin biosynthesis protein [Flavobacteriales bacterium]
SKSLKCEVIPYNSTAHNYTITNVPVYNFLSQLSSQYFVRDIDFSLGSLTSLMNHVPRIEYKNIIVSPAKWKWGKSIIDSIGNCKDIDALMRLFHQHHFPLKFKITEGDKYIPFDAHNQNDLISLKAALRKKVFVNIEEEFDYEDNQNIEFVAGVKNLDTPKIPSITIHENKKDIEQNLAPGSEWLYIKIYLNSTYSDHFLVTLFNSWIGQNMNKGQIQKFFFIRYKDPDYHLRLRLNIKPSDFHDLVNSFYLFIDAIKNELGIHKVSIETYERELKRYGANIIEDNEALFCFQSQVCLAKLMQEDASITDNRLIYAISFIDYILTFFNFGLIDKQKLVNHLFENFKKEFAYNKKEKIEMDQLYRKLRPSIQKGIEEIPEKLINQSLNEKMKNCCKLIIENFNSQLIDSTFEGLVASHLHMICNRIFKDDNRKLEFFSYFMMDKFYRSEIAQKKHLVSSK